MSTREEGCECVWVGGGGGSGVRGAQWYIRVEVGQGRGRRPSRGREGKEGCLEPRC